MPLLSPRKAKRNNQGNYRLVSISSILGKVMEQKNLEAVSKHMKKKVTGSSQHRFTKRKLFLNNLITFYAKRMN